MPVAPAVAVAAPPLTPPGQGLIAATPLVVEGENLPDRWEAGVRFDPELCGIPDLWDICSNAMLEGSNNHEGVRDFTPFVAITYDSCSAFGADATERAARARRAAVAKATIALEREFWLGELIPGNAHLASAEATTIGTALSPRAAMIALTQGLADASAGRGMIHARPGLVTAWIGDNVIHWVQNRWENARGDIVVPGSGYPGTGPAGEAVVGGTEWAYATEMVQVYRGEIILRPGAGGISEAMRTDDAYDHRYNNTLTYRAEQALAAVHSGCASTAADDTHLAVSVTVA